MKKQAAENSGSRFDPDKILEEIDSLSDSYRFSQFSERLDKLTKNPEGFDRQALARLSSGAMLFLKDIGEDLKKRPIDIDLVLRDGAEITTVFMSEQTGLRGRLKSGDARDLQWTDFGSDELMDLYSRLVSGLNDKEQRMRRHRPAVAFEWLVGDRNRAVSAAARLSEDSEDFKKWWDSLSDGLPD